MTAVLVVGAGPVGLFLAGELALRGTDVTVLEQRTVPSDEVRASTLHARTMELLDQRGLLPAVGERPRGLTGHFGGLPLAFDGVDSPYPGLWKVPQPELAHVLEKWAIGLGVTVRRGVQVTDLHQDGDGIEAADSTGRRHRAAYLVGCDGEGSLVRRVAGIGMTGRPADRELLAADVAGIEVRDRRFERLRGGLAVAARRPDGVTRLMSYRFGAALPDRAGPPDYADVATQWQTLTGEDVGDGTALWLHAFRNDTFIADTFRVGRLLLAGDSAHRQLPTGGQALNLGLHDAVNLGWKLAAQVAGWAPPGLLDSYAQERREAGRRALASSQAQAALLMGAGEVEAVREVLAGLLRHPRARDRLATAVAGVDVHHGGTGDQVGLRLRPGPVPTELGDVPLSELLRSGRGLLLAREPQLQSATPWFDRVDRVLLRDGGTAAEFASVLLRPDGHIAWTAGPTRLDSALARWFGDPASDLVSLGPTRNHSESAAIEGRGTRHGRESDEDA